MSSCISMKTKTATIKILDEINIAVIGLSQEEYKVLSNQFAVFAKSYMFTPLFKLRKWDGKIRYFSQSGGTYLNLLREMIPVIKKMGYTIKYIDRRAYHSIEIPKVDEFYLEDWGITLGSHQVGAINAIAEHGNGMLIAGTGAGKTLITAVLCDLYERVCGLKIVVIVPNIDLIGQTADELRMVDLVVGTYSGDSKSLEENIIVSTWQSIQNNPMIMSQFQAVIVDECFHGATPVLTKSGWKDIQDILPGEIVINFSENDGSFKEDVVVEVHRNLTTSKTEHMFLLEFDNDVKIRVTGNHKFLTKNRGWVRADDLNEKDELESVCINT